MKTYRPKTFSLLFLSGLYKEHNCEVAKYCYLRWRVCIGIYTVTEISITAMDGMKNPELKIVVISSTARIVVANGKAKMLLLAALDDLGKNIVITFMFGEAVALLRFKTKCLILSH